MLQHHAGSGNSPSLAGFIVQRLAELIPPLVEAAESFARVSRLARASELTEEQRHLLCAQVQTANETWKRVTAEVEEVLALWSE